MVIDETNIAYLLGRWFAVLEDVRQRGGKDIEVAPLVWIFNCTSLVPAYVFPLLQKISRHRMNKLDGANRTRIKELLTEILEKLETGNIQRQLTLEDQGMFILGYSHQQQKYHQKR